MKWHTEIQPEKIKIPIRFEDKIMALGSCFTENIGEKLANYKYSIDVNPFGIQYNPISIAKGITYLIDKRIYNEKDIIEYGAMWHSFDHHGNFSDLSKNICIDKINLRLKKAGENILKTNFLILTLGTSRIYFRKDNGEVVNNCHKLPASFFEQRRLGVDEIFAYLESVFERLFELNSSLQIILTVSPVRHLKDGFHESQLSKSTLLLVTDRLCRQFKQVHYFPAYEIMMDDLREYRFYKEDMVHPNEIAVNYIYERFENACLSDKEFDLRKKIRNLMQASQHKLLNPNSESSKQFIQNQISDIQKLCLEYPFLDFSRELDVYHFKLSPD